MKGKIIVIRQRVASGKVYEPDKEYAVPQDISEADAKILINMRSAEWIKKEQINIEEMDSEVRSNEGKRRRRKKKDKGE